MSLHRWMLAVNLTPVLWVSVGTLVIALGTAFLLVWQNSHSRNLALALAVLSGAVLAFFIQLAFELQSSASEDEVAVALVIDQSVPMIRQPHHDIPGGAGITMEAEASAWLAQHKPNAFRTDLFPPGRLVPDFILFSLIALLAGEEPHWQPGKFYTFSYKAMPHTSWSGFSSGISPWRPWQMNSTRDNCTVFTAADFRFRLAQAGNLFADALQNLPNANERVCLPPQSTLTISAQALAIRTPLCEIVFHVEVGGVADTSAAEPPDYVPQYIDLLTGLYVETTYFALRASHAQRSTYQEWTSRLISRVREWFGSA